jgi:predicted transcriptional regulator
MRKISRRDKLKIYGDLLSALNLEAKAEKVVLTRVQVQVKVPYDRLKNYLFELKELGLIQDENTPKLTQKGKQYLIEYNNVLEFMNRMGLVYY